jgi:probable HAF family extracellular repeat protein
MVDLGTFGGTCTIATGINDHGKVVGVSVTGDHIERPFLWEHGSFQDLGGSFGGTMAGAEGLNDRGQTAGFATLPGDTIYHAALWKHVGDITNLGVVGNDPCSFATSINGRTQVVGASMPDCNVDNTSRAFLWEDGSIFDLNTLVLPGASLHLPWAQDINDHGEIAGTGNDANGNGHAFLLIPCDEHHAGVAGCDYSLVDATAATPGSAVSVIEEPTTTPRARALYGPANNVRRMPRRRPGPLSQLLRSTTGSVADLETPISGDSDWQVEDKIEVFDRAEPAADSSSENPCDAVQPCIPIGHRCFGPGRQHCCPAPFPHHSFCSSRTGWGRCLMS